jgi:hypothetical protein
LAPRSILEFSEAPLRKTFVAATFQLQSASVAKLAEKLSSAGEVTSYDIVQGLVATHAYGGRRAGERKVNAAPSDAKRKPIKSWLDEASSLYELADDEFFDGRRVIFGLALLDKQLFHELSGDGFLQALEDELAQRSGLQLSGKGKRSLAKRRPARVAIPVLDDAPAEIDELGRSILAHVLAGRIRRAYGQRVLLFGIRALWQRLRWWLPLNEPSGIGLEPLRSTRAALFHVDGRWGSGKSSLLNFVASELKGEELPKDDRWVVVTFNAWQHQRLEPPWWWLTTTLHQKAVRELWPIAPRRAAILWLWSVWWRIRDVWLPYIVFSAAAIGGFFLWRGGVFGHDLKTARDFAESIAKIAAFVALVWGTAKALSHWFLTGPGGSAAAVLERTRDPLRLVRSRFARIVDSIRHPVAIFVDDLDRCQDTYVVQLLEGIQTLFIEEPVVFVVAADSGWLSDAYMHVYTSLAEKAGEPGRPLGSLFLEKAFQHNVRLARIPDDIRERYWNRLLGEDGESEGPTRDARRAAEEIFESLSSAGEIIQTLREKEDEKQLDPYALRLAAARALEGRAVESDTRHMLDHFSGLLEDNPRAMKKLVNAYGIELEVRLPDLPGDQDTLRQLALWTILSLRWPLLAEYLAIHPGEVDWIGKDRRDETGEEAKPDDFTPELELLFRKAAVREVVEGKKVEPPVTLDSEAITRFVGADMVRTTSVTGAPAPQSSNE